MQGDTLFETLLLNLIPYDKETPFKRKKEDAPIWELADPFQPRSAPNGYLDYLTSQNRRVLFDAPKADETLFVRKMTMAPGMKIEGEFPNPMMYYRKDKERGYLPLRFNEARALWRDSSRSLSATRRTPPTARLRLASVVRIVIYPKGNASASWHWGYPMTKLRPNSSAVRSCRCAENICKHRQWWIIWIVC